MDKKEKVSDEELASIKEISSALEKVKMQHKIHELEYKLAISNIYVKYKLSAEDTIDASGEIKRKTEEPKKAQELAPDFADLLEI
jgi:hypothetical protein